MICEAMGRAISHRGRRRALNEPGVGFARRLAIIDLKSGNQPIGNEDGSIQIVFNGEIYNYQTLQPNRWPRSFRHPERH